MRKLLLYALLSSAPLFATGAVQQTINQLGTTNTWVLAYNWTGDSSTGTVPITAGKGLGCCQGFLITQVEMIPGSPSPTNGYSVKITDAAGVDVLGGAASALSSTAPQAFAAASSSPPMQGSFSLVLTGQSVASAKGVVLVYLVRPDSVLLTSLTYGAVPIPLTSGGTSAALTASNGGVVYSTATQFAISAPAQLEYVSNTIGGKELIVGGSSAGASSFAVGGTFSVPFVNADFVVTNTAVGSDSASSRSVVFITAGTGGSIGSENHVVKSSPAASGNMFAVVAGVHSDVLGNGAIENVGLYVSSDHVGWVATGTRADSGIIVQGADGWNHGFQYYDTNAAILMDVDQYGNISNQNGYLTTGGHNSSAGIYPVFNVSTGCQGWNLGAAGEVDYFNCQNSGTGGFSWYQQTGASAATLLATLSGATGKLSPLLYGSQTACASAASPAVCVAAPAGAAVIAAGGATTVVINTTAVTANSQIVVAEDSGLGAKLSVTCNTQALTTLGAPRVTARSAGVSFTVGIDVSPTTNPMCLSYWIIN